MSRPTGPSNSDVRKLANALKKRKEYRELAESLLAPNRMVPELNLSFLEEEAKDGEAVATSGKVLGGGILKKSVIVFARGYSADARKKIAEAGGKALSLDELLNEKKSVKLL